MSKIFHLTWPEALWLLALFIFIPLQSAHAYLDPGTGSYAVQVIIGLVFGATFFLRNIFAKMGNFIQNIFNGKKKND